MLTFNEGKACDAVIRHLERQHDSRRANVVSHDNHPEPGKRIELTFELGPTLYAIEHTGIEPFPDFMRMNGESGRLYDPISRSASARLPGNEIVELHLPVGALFNKSGKELRDIQTVLVNFIVGLIDSIPLRDYADYRRPYIGTPIAPPNVPFEITVYRFRPPPGVAVLYNFMLKNILPANYEELRVTRIQAACDKKFPKLAAWKNAGMARTVLVLEDNDIQLTNQANVTEAYLPIATSRNDCPDETYLMMTISDMWYICPILINGQSYFDIAEAGRKTMFEVDSRNLSSITART